MKSTKRWFLFCFCISIICTSPSTQAGQGSDNGASRCKMPDGRIDLCDFSHSPMERPLGVFPYTPDQKRTLKELPESTQKALSAIERFFTHRYGWGADTGIFKTLQALHLYSVSKLFTTDGGTDPTAESPQPVAGWLSFSREVYNHYEQVRLIEFNEEQLLELPYWSQGLVFVHEALHHMGYSHDMIFVFIQSLKPVLKIYSEQLDGRRTALTPSELQAVIALDQVVQRHFNTQNISFPDLSGTYLQTEGGGIIRRWSTLPAGIPERVQNKILHEGWFLIHGSTPTDGGVLLSESNYSKNWIQTDECKKLSEGKALPFLGVGASALLSGITACLLPDHAPESVSDGILIFTDQDNAEAQKSSSRFFILHATQVTANHTKSLYSASAGLSGALYSNESLDYKTQSGINDSRFEGIPFEIELSTNHGLERVQAHLFRTTNTDGENRSIQWRVAGLELTHLPVSDRRAIKISIIGVFAGRLKNASQATGLYGGAELQAVDGTLGVPVTLGYTGNKGELEIQSSYFGFNQKEISQIKVRAGIHLTPKLSVSLTAEESVEKRDRMKKRKQKIGASIDYNFSALNLMDRILQKRKNELNSK